MSALQERVFTNADQEVVEYDGSPVTWRISVYAVITQGDQVLIIKDKRESLCDVLGGGMEIGETIPDALGRETMEEGGARVKIGQILHAQNGWFYHKREKVFYQTMQLFYEAELVEELTDPTEENVEWRKFVPRSEIGTTYRLPPVVEQVIKNLR